MGGGKRKYVLARGGLHQRQDQESESGDGEDEDKNSGVALGKEINEQAYSSLTIKTAKTAARVVEKMRPVRIRSSSMFRVVVSLPPPFFYGNKGRGFEGYFLGGVARSFLRWILMSIVWMRGLSFRIVESLRKIRDREVGISKGLLD